MGEESKLPAGSYSISEMQHYFEYIIMKHETVADKSPDEIYVNRIHNWVTSFD